MLLLYRFAAETLPQILIDTVELRPNNRCTQYSLDPRLVPAQLPPELLAQAEAAAAPPPPPPPAQQQQQHASVAPTVRPSTPPAAGEQHTRVSPEESADKAALSTQAASAADSKRDEPVVQEAAASGQASSAVQKTIAAAEAAASKAGSAVSCAATQVCYAVYRMLQVYLSIVFLYPAGICLYCRLYHHLRCLCAYACLSCDLWLICR